MFNYKFMVEKPQHDTENTPQNSFENCYPHIYFLSLCVCFSEYSNEDLIQSLRRLANGFPFIVTHRRTHMNTKTDTDIHTEKMAVCVCI